MSSSNNVESDDYEHPANSDSEPINSSSSRSQIDTRKVAANRVLTVLRVIETIIHIAMLCVIISMVSDFHLDALCYSLLYITLPAILVAEIIYASTSLFMKGPARYIKRLPYYILICILVSWEYYASHECKQIIHQDNYTAYIIITVYHYLWQAIQLEAIVLASCMLAVVYC